MGYKYGVPSYFYPWEKTQGNSILTLWCHPTHQSRDFTASYRRTLWWLFVIVNHNYLCIPEPNNNCLDIFLDITKLKNYVIK